MSNKRTLLSDEEKKERILASKRRYREKNKEILQAKKDDWVQKNIEHVRQYGKEYYYKKNLDNNINKLKNKLDKLIDLKNNIN